VKDLKKKKQDRSVKWVKAGHLRINPPTLSIPKRNPAQETEKTKNLISATVYSHFYDSARHNVLH
jgi:hypothetical protein